MTIIHAGRALLVPGEAPVSEVSVLIREGRVLRIEKGYVSGTTGESSGAVIIDLRAAFVLPGLIDSHVHLSAIPEIRGFNKGFPGDNSNLDFYPVDSFDQRSDVYGLVTVLKNAEKTLQSGYTTVRDLGAPGWNVFAARDAINAGEFQGPRIFAAGSLIRIGVDGSSGACFSVETCRQAVRLQIEKGADVIKVYGTCSGAKTCAREGAPPLFLEDEMRAIVEVANSRGLRVTSHAHATAGIKAALVAGAASVEHGSYNDPETRALFRKSRAYLVPTMSVEDRIAREIKFATGPMKQVMADFQREHAKRMIEAYRSGVLIAAGSDAGIVPHGDNARELEWYVDLGMPNADAIVAATRNAADLLGQSANIGSIEPGKYADIIAVVGDPLVDIGRLRSVSFVMKGGVVIRH